MKGDLNPERMRQVPYRTHENDYRILKKFLADDGLTFQGLVKVCVKAYVEGNPLILKLLKQHAELSLVPQEVLDRYTLSRRERENLLNDIEKEEDKKPIGDE